MMKEKTIIETNGNESDEPIMRSEEQELSAKFFERVERMAEASIILAEKTAPLSEPFPDIDPETVEEIDAVFDRIGELFTEEKNPNVAQLLDSEAGPIYWEKIGAKFGLDGKTMKKLHDRYLAEIDLWMMLRTYAHKRFGSLKLEDMHQLWFYEPQGDSFEGIKMSFAGWMRQNGVPKIYSGCLMVPERLWQKKMTGDKTFGRLLHDKEIAENSYLNGLYFPPSKNKESDNPLDLLGLVLIREAGESVDEKAGVDGKARRLLTALHENMHRLDLLANERRGDDRIIAEIIAFRSKIYHASRQRISGQANNYNFDALWNDVMSNYVQRGKDETSTDFAKREKKISDAFEAYVKIESHSFSIAAVEHILMNCLTLDDLIAWSKIDAEGNVSEDYEDWKKEILEKREK